MKPDERVAVHNERLKVKKMKEIVKSMNAKNISIEELVKFYGTCPSVEQERRAKLDKYRKVRTTNEKRKAGLKKALLKRHNKEA